VPGTRVGAYEIESVRARLPHVVIHRARHVVTGRPVALQLLRAPLDGDAAHAGGSLRGLRRDLAALNRLRHAHVAEILETGELADGRPFLVVEWIAGRSLQTLLDQRVRLPLDEALPIVEQIAAALSAGHALGVVHGDLSARNVGLVARGEHLAVKLAAFGMASLACASLPSASPSSSAEASRAGDLFALGALVYQMVTGRRPPQHPAPPSTYAELPHAFDEVVLRCLRGDAAHRWASVDDFVTALRAAASGSELIAELYVTAYLDPAIADIEAAALDDAERALSIAQRWLEEQDVALVLPGAGAVVATARIPRALEQQRAARAGWVKLGNAVRERMEARKHPHPTVRTRVQIRVDG